MKKILIGALLLTGCALPVMACTGISATAKDGGYVQARSGGIAICLVSMW